MGKDLEHLKQRFPLLEYLQRHHWTGHPVGKGSEFVGLCPLHEETHPSFYVNPHKNLFYCHGCGRGGDLIRFVELSQRLSYLRQQLAPAAQLLDHTAAFYRLQLSRHPEAVHYLLQRGLRDPRLVEELGIGYAPGGTLRSHLSDLGYSLELLLETGLIGPQGQDAFCRRVIFAWESVCHSSHVILVEGVFDLALLWQEGFRNTTCAIGTHLTPLQWDQLCDSPDRRVDIVFDQDDNQAGQQAAQALAERLHLAGLTARIVRLPAGQDPNSFFLGGANRGDFIRCLEEAESP